MRKSRLSKVKQSKLMEHFVAGTSARCAADLVGVNRKTAIYYYHRLREIIAYKMSLEIHEIWDGEIEVDESYFGGKRKGKRGRGAAGKVPVFGLLKRGGKVYTKVITDASSKTLMPIIRDKVIPDSIVYSDCWRGYNVLDTSEFKHYRINHSKLFADKKNHINGIENFWPSFSGDDFTGGNGDPPDLDIWEEHSSTDVQATIQSNKMYSSCGQNQQCYYFSRFKISGDFSVQVDLDSLSDLEAISARLMATNLSASSTHGAYGMFKYNSSSRRMGSNFNTGSWGSESNPLRSNTYGGIRITRTGNTLYVYLKDGGGSYALDNSTAMGSAPNLYIWLNLLLNSAGSASVNFDNLLINSGTVVYPL